MDFQCINIRQVPWEVLKTAAFGLGFQHLARDLANVNTGKTMFDPYFDNMYVPYFMLHVHNHYHSVGKFSRRQIDDIFLIFPRKQNLTFQAN